MYSESFYSDLPTLTNFIEITNHQNFVIVPDDWYILITDVIGSTKAIEAGRYKDVNLIGACCIMAVLNIAIDKEIPFIFGGDGASILIPPSLFLKAKEALLGTQHFAKQEFNLDLRVGIVPVSVVNDANYEIKIAKLKISANYHQAIFTGGGLTYATDLIKSPIAGDLYNLKNTSPPAENPNFSGLSCPWQDIPSPHGEVLSLIVMANGDRQQQSLVYRELLEKITKTYGSWENFHPVLPENIKLALNNQSISRMVKVQTPSSKCINKLWLLLRIELETLIMNFLILFNIKLKSFDWKLVSQNLVTNTDYKKFDDILRMIIAGNGEQREELVNFLEKSYQSGKLVYGIHVSNRVLMTCLVSAGVGREVHLVDGADGGYTLAAKDMKARANDRRYPVG